MITFNISHPIPGRNAHKMVRIVLFLYSLANVNLISEEYGIQTVCCMMLYFRPRGLGGGEEEGQEKDADDADILSYQV